MEVPLATPVLSRELYVASVENKSQVIPSMMALYANTKLYPLPSIFIGSIIDFKKGFLNPTKYYFAMPTHSGKNSISYSFAVSMLTRRATLVHYFALLMLNILPCCYDT